MCGNKAVVKNSEALLERSKQLLGPEKTYQLIENTLYKVDTTRCRMLMQLAVCACPPAILCMA